MSATSRRTASGASPSSSRSRSATPSTAPGMRAGSGTGGQAQPVPRAHRAARLTPTVARRGSGSGWLLSGVARSPQGHRGHRRGRDDGTEPAQQHRHHDVAEVQLRHVSVGAVRVATGGDTGTAALRWPVRGRRHHGCARGPGRGTACVGGPGRWTACRRGPGRPGNHPCRPLRRHLAIAGRPRRGAASGRWSPPRPCCLFRGIPLRPRPPRRHRSGRRRPLRRQPGGEAVGELVEDLGADVRIGRDRTAPGGR